MNEEDKQARLNQLKRIVYPSDQEIGEMEILKEELTIQADGLLEQAKQEEQIRLLTENIENKTGKFSGTKINLGEGKGFAVPIKKQKRSLIGIIMEKLKEKPATWDEINQLKLEKQKAILKRDILLAKSQTPSKLDKIMNTLTMLSNTPEENKKAKRKPFKL